MSRIITPAMRALITRPPMRRQQQTPRGWRQLPQQQQRFFQGACPCCAAECGNCPNCDPVIAPAQWVMTVTGMDNQFCSHCSLWGGEHTLTNDCLWQDNGSTCIWSTPIVHVDDLDELCAPSCNDCSRWQLIITADFADLVADGAGMGGYSLPLEDFDCDGSNVMVKAVVSPHCIWPDTITIEPV